ncbi:MAG: hypothetical protein ACOC0O_03475 [Spirochaetota bacterium]
MSVDICPVGSRRALREFIEYTAQLYQGNKQWVPVFKADYRDFYERTHPFFEHAEAEFLVARRDHDPVARVMMIKNDRYNAYHDRATAHFYFADFIDDEEVTETLFGAMADWARDHGLNELMGPLFSGATFGGGVLVKGHDHPAAMTMMPYNYAYYQHHYEHAGFQKHFDLYSLTIDPKTFRLPEKVERLADHVRKRGRMKVVEFRSKSELEAVAREVGKLYNPTLADHYENYPLTDNELERVIKDLLQIAQPDLEKVITYDTDVVGYMLGFPDVTPALQKCRGRLTPVSILRLLYRSRHTRKLILNGMAILERYQRLGGNALIYSEIARTVQGTPSYDFDVAEIVQINEQTDLMLSDMRRLGADVHKIHRVYRKQLKEAL